MARQQQAISWRPTLANVLVAASGVPVAMAFNAAVKSAHPAAILAFASAVLGAIVALLRYLAPAQPKLFYAFSLFAFTSVVDVLIPLEMDGFVEGFMDVYMLHGEPYLFSAWGALSAYWDGTFNLLCYLYMAFCVSNGISYRYTAIFYASNILNSMIVLLMGAFLSGVGLHWCTFLNIPYVLVPAYVLWTSLESSQPKRPSLPTRCVRRDLSVALLVLGMIFNIFRGPACLGSRVATMEYYRQWVEPLMNQKIPAPFAAVQHIVCAFYFAPAFLVLAIAVTKNPHRPWIKDLAVATAGAALQAEVCLVGMQWHPLTEELHHLPDGAGVLPGALHLSAHGLTLLAPALCAFSLFFPAPREYSKAPSSSSSSAKASSNAKAVVSSKSSSKSNLASSQQTKRRKQKTSDS